MKELLKNNVTSILIVVFAIVVLLSVYFYGKSNAGTPKQVKINSSDIKNDVAKDWDPNIDAQTIHDAITNSWDMIGANEDVVMAVLNNRNDTEIKLIYNAYMAMYGENLIEALDSEWITDFDAAIAIIRNAIS